MSGFRGRKARLRIAEKVSDYRRLAAPSEVLFRLSVGDVWFVAFEGVPLPRYAIPPYLKTNELRGRPYLGSYVSLMSISDSKGLTVNVPIHRVYG
jgi:hypothetical protein